MDYNQIRQARKAAGLTQEQLATLLGINRATLSRYENGEIDPPTSQIKRIAKALDIPLSELVGAPEEIQKAALEKLQETSQIAQEEVTSPWEKQRKFMQTVMGYAEVQNLALLSNAVEEQERAKRTEALNAVYEKLNSSCQEKVLGYAEGLAEDEENLVQYLTLPSPFSQSTEDSDASPDNKCGGEKPPHQSNSSPEERKS